MASLCIVPARGGSKRIPRKNIRPFFGKPIIAYSIERALESNLFKEVMVSTDDPEIAQIAKEYGATVPFMRSSENSGDYSTTIDVLLEVIENYNALGQEFDTTCCIYPTAPLLQIERLKEGYEKLLKDNYDTVFPICLFSYPIWRALHIQNEKVSMIWPENLIKRSQDLTPTYHDAGQWYWFFTKRFLQSKKIWTANSFGIEIGEIEVQDIDTEIDWKLAELKYGLQNTKA